jgi:SWIM zinc finger
MTVLLTEQTVSEMAPAPKTLLDARKLIKEGKLQKLAKNDDGTLVFGLCKGSGKSPYELSMDLATGGDRPTLRCTCPSHQFPCKHQLALMLAFAANGKSFAVAAPPAELLEKRAKIVERAEKKASAPEDAAPKKVNKAAQAKKTEEQGDALDTLEGFLVDLVSAGLGGLTAKSIKAIDTQAKRMADADMKGASGALQRLSALVSDEGDDDDEDEGRKAARGLTEERQGQIGALVAQLWVTVRKGRRALEGKLEEGASQSEADAQLESILGRAWQLPQLKEAGYWIADRALIELAHERTEDHVTEFIEASGYLLDLGDGSIVREWTALPLKAARFGKLRSSRGGVVEAKEAALYPGDVLNRRIRWDDKQGDKIVERARTPADYAKLHGHAKALDPIVKAFRGQIKNPLNPSDAVVLLAVKRFGTAGDALVAEDAAGGRLVIKDPRRASFETTRNLKHAAAAFGAGTLAVRLYFDLVDRAVFGQALSLFAGEKQIRLGM